MCRRAHQVSISAIAELDEINEEQETLVSHRTIGASRGEDSAITDSVGAGVSGSGAQH